MYFYTYIYFDPRNNEPFYVGKGKGNRAWANHSKNKQFNGRLRILKNQNLEPLIEILNTTNELSAFWLERCFIAAYGRKDQNKGPLFNHTDGGDGADTTKTENFLKALERTKKLGLMKGKNNPMYGRRGENSPVKGRKHTKEELAKMSANCGTNNFGHRTKGKQRIKDANGKWHWVL
jgi:hypothetical protein